MSWASHNVEAYDDILHKAIVARIQAELTANGFDGMCTDTITAIVESISQAIDRSLTMHYWIGLQSR